MVTTSGFTSTPVSRLLLLTIISTSLLTSILDIKHLLPIKPTPHLWPYLQFSRILTFQLAYISSTELLFGVVLFYQFRVLERVWGSRKFASFVAVVWFLTGLLTVTLGLVLKVVTVGVWGYIPPGVTGVVVAMGVVWRSEVPRLYGVKVMFRSGSGSSNGSARRGQGDESQIQQQQQQQLRDEAGVVLSDKFTMYVLAVQLALSQFPYQLVPALVGWVVGSAWREELLPMGLIRWRVPGWIVGEEGDQKRGQYEGLRRRLEEEGGANRDGMREVSDGVIAGNTENRQQPQRGFARNVLGYFTGGRS